MSVILKRAQFLKSLDLAEKEAVDRFRDRVRSTVKEGLRRLMAKTPVWTGQTVANYAVTAGAPYSGPVKPGFEPTPGTNNMPLGAEPNRPAAEAIAWATFEAVDFSDPYQQFYITNRAPQALLLEIGAAPDVARNRSPQGMFVITAAELELLLKSNKL